MYAGKATFTQAIFVMLKTAQQLYMCIQVRRKI